MPPNTLNTHLNNLHFHGNVRHGPVYYPRANIGYNAWTPSVPGFNHMYHINRLQSGRGWYNSRGYPGWPTAAQYPPMLEMALRGPHGGNLLPMSNFLMQQARYPVLGTYNGLQSRFYRPSHLELMQAYQRTNPYMRNIQLARAPSIRDQVAAREAARTGQAPGQFPFSAEGGMDAADPMDPRAMLNGLPRTTLQRMGDAIGSLFGRREEARIIGPEGVPRTLPETRSFPGEEATGPFNGTPEVRERQEALRDMAALRREVADFVRTNPNQTPATMRTINLLMLSIDSVSRGPTLNASHVRSARLFWDSIRVSGVRAQADLRGEAPPPTFEEENPQPAEEEAA